eukprot:COSAG03_NODE_11304_length_600_cov_1.107784_1_plen_94_part_10
MIGTVPHKTFKGDRVSMQLLLPSLSPLSLGHLLGCYSAESDCGALSCHSSHSHSTEPLREADQLGWGQVSMSTERQCKAHSGTSTALTSGVSVS